MLSSPPKGEIKILLTGANGQLGRELLRSLKPRGTVVAAVRPGSAAPPDCESRQADLACPHQIRELVREVRPHLIVNAAAYTAVDAAEQNQDIAMVVNGLAPGVLADEAAKAGAAIVHYSTDYVFSGAGQRAWREDDRPEPINFYGRSKLAGEESIRSAGVAHLILRTCWIYGSVGQNFVKKMLQLASQRSEIAVVDDQFGAPTSARFVADVTSEIIARAQGDIGFLKSRFATLHVACAGETSWYGFAKEVFRQAFELGLIATVPKIRPILSANYPSAAKRPLNSRLDTSQLRQRFSLVAPQWDAELLASLPGLYAQTAREMWS